MSRLFDELLRVREFGAEFLRPVYEDCWDPGFLPDIDKAVERICRAVSKGEKVLIYGDYDVDGVTASVVMHDALRLAGVTDIEVMLPNRFLDGYGMSRKCVERAKGTGVGLVITVDCGSRNHEIIDELGDAGIDVIVTDHHECGGSLPEAMAVVNPKRADALELAIMTSERSEIAQERRKIERAVGELRELAGAGVAFKVAQALVLAGVIPAGQEKWLLDLVLIGTVCDSMRLTGENRRFCYYGMKVLKKTRRLGLRELMRAAGVKEMGGEAIGFQIGPRLNAAGRMEAAEYALKLLMASSRTEAASLAQLLNRLNERRRNQQNAATREICERGVGEDPVIVVAGEWHEGVLGIIAGRLVEEYKRPAFVLANSTESSAIFEKIDATSGHQKPVSSRKSSADVTALTFVKQFSTEPDVSNISQMTDSYVGFVKANENNILKGSGRSFGEFNLAEALSVCGEYIVGGGGHAGACGLKVEAERLEDFRRAVNEYYKGLKLTEQESFLGVREDLAVRDFEELSLELLEEMRSLEPFGEGNAEPVFLLPEVRVVEVSKMGAEGEHLRLIVWDQQGRSLKLVQFRAPRENLRLQGGETVNVWISLVENEFRGIRSVEGRVLKLSVC